MIIWWVLLIWGFVVMIVMSIGYFVYFWVIEDVDWVKVICFEWEWMELVYCFFNFFIDVL